MHRTIVTDLRLSIINARGHCLATSAIMCGIFSQQSINMVCICMCAVVRGGGVTVVF